MQKGICLLTFIPVRRSPSEASEMVTQILFGEIFNVTDEQPQWVLVELDYDGYIGWVDKKQIKFINDNSFTSLKNAEQSVISLPFCNYREENSEETKNLLCGSTIYNPDGKYFLVLNKKYYLNNDLPKTLKDNPQKIIVDTAMQLLNTPYLWGGRSAFGIDCSGLVQTACKVAGIKMPRDASQQVWQGTTINSLDDSVIGDFLFFENDKCKIVHTGILITENKIIHASGSVRIDSIDQQGIFNNDIQKYTHKLKIIKRVV